MKPVMYGSPGISTLPSPAIWSRCNRFDIESMGCGRFMCDDFIAVFADDGTLDPTLISKCTNFVSDEATTALALDASSLPAVGGGLNVVTGATDNNAATLFGATYGKMIRRGSNPIFFESYVKVADVDQDAGFFCGLVANTGLDTDLILDDCAKLGNHTAIGFYAATAAGKLQALAQKKGGSAGVVVVINADVTLAAALGDDAAAWADATYYKIGMRFDGDTTVYVYVNGVEIDRWELADINFDADEDLCFAISGKTGAAATYTFEAGWWRHGFEAVR